MNPTYSLSSDQAKHSIPFIPVSTVKTSSENGFNRRMLDDLSKTAKIDPFQLH